MSKNSPSSPSSLIGGDWESRIDPSSGRTFYINHKTRQTSWTLPTAAKNDEEDAAAAASSSSSSSSLPEGWTATKDQRTGRMYYVNHR